jgi:hypothetical protein
MPKLSLGLSLNITKSGTFDSDSINYFSRAGVTDPTAKAQISAFAKGLKNLGLWNTSVCWMLKSSQNAGTGTTAYSFGGLGTYNGTLTNGPTWGVNGISFTSTSQEITLPDNSNLYNLRTGFVVYNPSDTAANQRLIEFQDGLTGVGAYCYFRYGGGTAGENGTKYFSTRNSTLSGNIPNTESASLNSFRSSAFTANNTSDNIFRDGSLVSGSSRTGLLSINPTGARNNRQLFSSTSNMVGSFGFISTATLSNSDISSLHSLYVSTLASNRDLDADAYILRAGVTDPTAQSQINSFVVGVKSIGIWDNMVCYPLRSSQNKGSGSTVYSLGGLGTYNGTMGGTSLPTWGANGLTNSVDGFIRSSVPWSTTHTGLAVYNQSSTSGLQTIFQFGDTLGGGNGRRTNMRLDNTLFLYNGSYTSYSFGPSSLNAFKMAGYGVAPSSSLLGYNDGATSTVDASPASLAGGTTTNNFNLLCAGGPAGDANTQFFTGTIGFVSAFNVRLSSGQFSSIYSLYKTTLGTGLGLP